jgi:5-methyltetrahydrofolate--homocysteine methyltransferase
VHDIGKNIVSLVLACNNYEVIDLGVMVPTEKIVEEVSRQKPDILGLSGLITPSLEEMVYVAEEMERAGHQIPVLVGGATTSKAHTAVKIAPGYSGPVVHVKDASQSVGIVDKLKSPKTSESFREELRTSQQDLREKHQGARTKHQYLSLEEARKNGASIDWKSYQPVRPSFLGEKSFNDFGLEEVAKYIDWTFFFHSWELRGKYPKIFDDPVKGKDARRLFDEGQKMLQQIIDHKMIRMEAVVGFYPANSEGDDLLLFNPENDRELIQTLPMLRNQRKKEAGAANLCLSDYVMPQNQGNRDYVGAFFATAGLGVDHWARHYEQDNDDYSAVMLKILAQRMAEAFAEVLHREVRQSLWGYVPKENLPVDDLLKEKYQGIRPAFGYPSLPDHTLKKPVFDRMKVSKHTQMQLTDSYMMIPEASVSGLYLAHPQSRYFNVQKVLEDQLKDYARRKGMDEQEIRRWLSENLA